MPKSSSINYIEYLDQIGIKLLEPLKRIKDLHKMQCKSCNHIFSTSPLGKIQGHKKYGKSGCPNCHKIRQTESHPITFKKHLTKIEQNGYIILSIVNNTLSLHRKQCNHTFSVNYDSMKNGLVECKVCSKSVTQNTFEKYLNLGSLGFLWTSKEYGVDYYKDNLTICVFDLNKVINKDKKYTLNIYNTFIKQGKRCLIFFSDEVITNGALISKKIQYISQSNNLPKIYARKCEIREVNIPDKTAFLNSYHIQGTAHSKINYGAYYNNELVAIMTFDAPRILMNKKDVGKNGYYELIRYATHSNFQVIGAASKLLSHFKKNNDWKNIYSFADIRWSLGNMYYKLGFKLAHSTTPMYNYVQNGVRKHRWGFRKDMLREKFPDKYDPSLTEFQNMDNIGIGKVWDCGMFKFNIGEHNAN